jgi:thiamine biosynthesis protein ThiS
MKVTLNNKIDIIDTKKTSVSVNELLAIKNFTFELLIVRINGALIKKENYSTANIVEGDDVHIIHVFGGG